MSGYLDEFDITPFYESVIDGLKKRGFHVSLLRHLSSVGLVVEVSDTDKYVFIQFLTYGKKRTLLGDYRVVSNPWASDSYRPPHANVSKALKWMDKRIAAIRSKIAKKHTPIDAATAEILIVDTWTAIWKTVQPPFGCVPLRMPDYILIRANNANIRIAPDGAYGGCLTVSVSGPSFSYVSVPKPITDALRYAYSQWEAYAGKPHSRDTHTHRTHRRNYTYKAYEAPVTEEVYDTLPIPVEEAVYDNAGLHTDTAVS